MADENPTKNGGGSGGIIKGVTEVASKTVGALSGFPMLLMLAILNVGMFSMMTWLIVKSAEYRFAERQELIKILTACQEDIRRRSGTNYETPGWTDQNTQKANQNTP